ncbi:MAG: hypothetical protein U0325_34680 [Polyangiales bacterium]
MYDGNAALLRTELDRYLSVSAADVQRVAREYLTAANRTVVDVLPPERPAEPAATPGARPAATPAVRPASHTRGSPHRARPAAPARPAAGH